MERPRSGEARAPAAEATSRTRRSRRTAAEAKTSLFLLGLLLAPRLCAGALAAAAGPAPTLLRKCCPPDQQLAPKLDECEAYADASGPPAGTEAEPVSALLQRSGSGFPWWVNGDTHLLDPLTGERATRPFLQDQDPAALIRYGTEPLCERNRLKFFTWNSRSRYKLFANGTLHLRTDGADASYLPLAPDDYCVDRVAMPGEVHAFLTCPCKYVVCLNKCCGRYDELNVEVYRKLLKPKCEKRDESNAMWKPSFFSGNWSAPAGDAPHLVLDTLFPKCDASSDLVVLNSDEDARHNRILVQLNGSAVMEGYGHGVAYAPTRWCADTSLVGGAWRVDNALICQVKSVAARNPVAGLLYGSLFVVSSLFTLATLCVYALLPDMRRSVHAKALLCHVGALLAGSLALAVSQLRQVVNSRIECYATGFFIQYAMLATFSWLNAVCFDMAWTFRKFLPTNASGSRDNKKFLYYSLYAWGCPAVITVVTAVLEFGEGIPKTVIKPNFGVRDCWFYKLPAQFAYFYGPVAVSLLANIAMYGYTAAQLVRARRDTALVDRVAGGGDAGATSSRSVLGSTKERLILHVKLFLLMGVTWVMECVSAIVGLNDAYWYFSDSVNILRGFFVFVIFCCKKDVIRRLRERLHRRKGKAKGGRGKGREGRGGEGAASKGYVGPAALADDEEEEGGEEGRHRRSSSGTGGTSSDTTGSTSLPMAALSPP